MMNDKARHFAFSSKAGRTPTPPINFLMDIAVAKKGTISLAAGLVDHETLPTDETNQLVNEIFSDKTAGQDALQYGTTDGLSNLRKEVLDYVCHLDGITPEEISVSPDNVIISSGSQQLLYIITDILIDPGDIVITEWPSYFVYTGVLMSMGASVRAIEMDENGMITESLAETLEQLKRSGELHRVKIIYLCDYYQNPTGLTLSQDRRKELIEIVRSYCINHRICILEDAAYRELYYDTDSPPPSIKSFDSDNSLVVLAQTFSKSFSPGMKTGYAILPDELIEPVLNQKGNHDFGSCNFVQHIILRAMQSGNYARHVEMLKQRYKEKRDAILKALEENLGDFLPDQTHWTHPGGGLYVYLTVPEWIDTGQKGLLFKTALEEGVVYVPGEFCYGPDPRRKTESNHMRLTFGTVKVEEIYEGIARLSRAIKRVAKTQGNQTGKRSIRSSELM